MGCRNKEPLLPVQVVAQDPELIYTSNTYLQNKEKLLKVNKLCFFIIMFWISAQTVQ